MDAKTLPEQPGLMAELDRLSRGAPVQSDGAWRASYALYPDFIGFSGHFPDYKLLPAMMQVCMATHMLTAITGVFPEVSAISSAKFTEQALPGEVIEIAATRLPDKNNEQVWDFSIIKSPADSAQATGDARGQVASFRLLCKAV